MPHVSDIVGKALSSEVVTSQRGQGVLPFALSYGHKIYFVPKFVGQDSSSFFGGLSVA